MFGGCPVFGGYPVFGGCLVFGGCPVFEGCPVFGGCPLFGGCPDSEISHGRRMSQGFGGCLKDFKYKTNIFVLKINFHT